MQATKSIVLDNVGRVFRYGRVDIETVSGRTQNWLDVDGTVSGLNEPTLIGSGLPSAGMWWAVDDEVQKDVQGPVVFVQQNNGPSRGLAHIRLEWDAALHSTVGSTACVNGRSANSGPYCPPHGYIRHLGKRFSGDNGLPVTAQPEVVGLAGGYGWLLTLDEGAPKELKISQTEVLPGTPLLFSVQYPLNTAVTVTAHAANWCYATCDKPCQEEFSQVSTVDEVRRSDGNVFHLDPATGLLTIRVIMYPETYTGAPDWKLFDFSDIGPDGGYALKRFERKGVLLPRAAYSSYISITADCVAGGTNNAYCAQQPDRTLNLDGSICPADFVQKSYDRCCDPQNLTDCVYPYSFTPPPTMDPNQTPAPTPLDPEVLSNGGFEEGDLCPWEGSWNVGFALDESTVIEGSAAARITGRTATWQGLGQQVFGKLQPDVPYDFQGYIYILASGTFRTDATIQATYDTSTESCTRQNSYHTIYSSSSVTGQQWHTMSGSFTFLSSSLDASCTLVGLRFYIQSPNFTYDFVIDGLSLYKSSTSA